LLLLSCCCSPAVALLLLATLLGGCHPATGTLPGTTPAAPAGAPTVALPAASGEVDIPFETIAQALMLRQYNPNGYQFFQVFVDPKTMAVEPEDYNAIN